MIARLDNLRKHPAVFRHLTGITVEVFDELAADVVPAVEAAHEKALPPRDWSTGCLLPEPAHDLTRGRAARAQAVS